MGGLSCLYLDRPKKSLQSAIRLAPLLLSIRARLPKLICLLVVKKFWWENKSDSDKRGKTVCLLSNRPIFWLLDGPNRTRLEEVVLLPPSSNTTTIPSPVIPAITRIATNQLYFPCTITNYSHYPV